MNRLKYIFSMLLLLAALQAARAQYVIDRVCVGSTRQYRIDGEPGSTYFWLVYDSSGDPVALTEDPEGTEYSETDSISGITQEGSEISIEWTQTGDFKLATIQYSKFGCDTIEQGDVKVFPLPADFAGPPVTICAGAPVILNKSTASNYSSLLWTTPGDGIFDNPLALHPIYQPGPNDILAGGVTLKLTALCLGNGNSCLSAISTVQVTIVKLTAQANKSDITCFGANDGRIVISKPLGGSGSYEFMIDGVHWDNSKIFSNLAAGTYQVKMRDAVIQVCISDLGSFTIAEPPKLEAIFASTNTTCLGNDGTITISNPKGGWGNYEFSVDGLNWQSGMGFLNLVPGTYNISIRDANYTGCQVSLGSATITEPTKLSADAIGTPVTCFGSSDGTITISNAVGGSGIYKFSIDGSIWSSTLKYNGLSPGSYKVQMRDANTPACVVDVTTITITGPSKLNAGIVPHDITCFGSNDGVIDLNNPTGGSGLYEFSKDGITWQTQNQFINLPPNTYTVSIRDAKVKSCIVTFNPLTIHEPPQMTATVEAKDITCFGSKDGRILISKASGGSGSHQYSIDGANWINLPEFNNLGSGLYAVQMRDANMHSCIVQLGTWQIIEPEILHAVVDHTNTTCMDNDGTITLSNPTGGSGNYQYSIDGTNWQVSGLFTNLTPKFYQVKIRDSKQVSCWLDLESVEIVKPIALSATASGKDVSCFGGHDGEVAFADVIGGSGFYEFSVDGINWSANPTIGNLSIGTYAVKMRDAKTITCVLNVASITIIQPIQLNASLAPVMVSCFGDSDGKIIITNPVGGSGGYEYSVDGSSWTASPEIKNLAAGSYTVQMRDANATLCVVNLPALVITEPAQLQAVVKQDNITCFGSTDGRITISGSVGGSGSFEYSIDGSTWGKIPVYGNLAKGNYQVEMRDANTITCFVTLATVEIIEPAILAGDVIPTNTTCSGNDGTITISNSSGGWGSYEYSIDNIIWKPTPQFTGLIAGTYPVSIRDAATISCVIPLETVIIKPLVAMDAVPDHLDITCFGANDGKISFLNPTGGSGIYEYSVDGGTKWQTSPIFQNLAPGNYDLQLRDANSKTCVKAIQNISLTQPQILAATVTSVNETYTTAKDGSITIINPTGGSNSYVYSIDGVNWQNSGTFTNLGPNNFKVWIGDAITLTCKLQLSTEIITTIVPLLANVTHSPTTCFTATDGTITINPTSGSVGNYQYTIDGGSTWVDSPVFSALPSGDYFVFMRDRVHPGYQALLENITITRPDLLTAVLSSTKESFVGANDGTITVQSPAGGSGSFEYSRDGVSWQSNPLFANLSPGTYNITMRDTKAPGCFVSLGSAVILKGNQISATITPKDVVCYGGNNGSFTVSKEGGGSGNYQYSIDNGVTWNTKAAFQALKLFYGLYPVSMRDATNTSITVVLGNFKINQPDAIVVSISEDAPIPFPGGTTMVTVSASGGKAPYSGTGTYPVSSGKHSYTVTDVSGCTGTSEILVSEPGVITIAATAVGSPCFGVNGSILFTFANVPDGVYDILYDFSSFKNVLITGGKATVSAPAGTYNNLRLVIKGNSTNKVSVVIDQLPPVIISATPIQSQCIGVNGSIEFWFKNVPDGKYDIVHDNGKFTAVQVIGNWAQVQNVFAGNYKNLKLLISTCSSNTVNANLDPPIGLTPIAMVTEQPTCTVPTGKVVVTYPAFGNGYEYSINGGAFQQSDTFSGLNSGPNLVRVREISNGCESQETTVNVDLIPLPPVAPTASVTVQPTCDFPTGSIVVTNPFGSGYEFNIDGGTYSSSASFTGLLPGKHQLRVRSIATGCESSITEETVDPVPSPPATPLAVVTKQPDCFDQTGTIVVTTPAINTGFVYNIDGGSYQASTTFAGLVPGKHQLRVRTKISTCESDSLELIINDPILPSTPTVMATVKPDCNIKTGTIEVTSPLGPDFQYSFDGKAYQTLLIFTNLAPGSNHTIKVLDITTGCESMELPVVIDPLPIDPSTPSASVTQPDCIIATGEISVTTPEPGINYTLTSTNPAKPPITNTTGLFTGLLPGVYGLTATNTAGCTSAAVNKTINPQPAIPTAPTASDLTECEKSPIQTLDARTRITGLPSGTTIKWYDNAVGGTLVASPTLNSIGSIVYYAEATNGTCVSTSRTAVTLTINPVAVPLVSQNPVEECAKSPLQTIDARTYVSVQPGVSLIWYDKAIGGSVTLPVLNTIGTKTYYAETFNGQCTSTKRTGITLTIYALPAIPEATVTVPPSCKNEHGTIEITKPLGSEYVYSVDNSDFQASVIFSELKSKTYTLRAKNINTDCESVSGTVILPPIPPTPIMKSAVAENCKCYGDSGSINFEFENVADGTYVIVYLGGQFKNVRVANGIARVQAIAGTYSILAIEANGCTSAENRNVVINQPDQLSVSAVITEIDLKSGQKGEIDLTITGGTGSYLSVWEPNPQSGFAGGIKEDIFNLNNGDYVVTVTDQNGCQQTKTLTIPLPNLPPIATNDEFSAGCGGVSGDLLYTDNGNGIDSDPDGDTFTIDTTPIGSPTHASFFVINPDGTFVYKAVPGYSGDDSFRYIIKDVKNNPSNPANVIIHVVSDFDCDGIADDLDPDADGDGILNTDEGDLTTDTDGDGHPNWLDIDADNDGIVDNYEAQSAFGYIAPKGIDTNHDGIDDAYDPVNGGTRLIPIDTDAAFSDGDGIPDFLDTDSDNDHVPDYIEGHDKNADGKPDFVLIGKDADADGLDDGFDTVDRYASPLENMTDHERAPMQDFDGDGLRDWRDENDDDDQYLTRFEDLNADGDYSNDDIGHSGHPEYLWFGRDCELFIPDAFSPNEDNIHDYFQIYCIESFPNAKMYIFDQLGNKLFEKEHYGNLNFWGTHERAWWDGRTTNRTATAINGKVAPGTYFYVLQLGNGEVKKSFVFVSY